MNSVKIILQDNTEEVVLDVNKYMLLSSSNYFQRLLTFGKESVQSQISIIVGDAHVAFDVIMSLVDPNYIPKKSNKYPGWLYILKTLLCRDYFCLENDPTLLYELVVPSKGFDFLLKVVDELNYSCEPKILEMVKRNLPENYPLENFTTEFIGEMLKLCKFQIVYADNDFIVIRDIENGIIHQKFGRYNMSINKIVVSNNYKYLAYAVYSDMIIIYDLGTNNILHIFQSKYGTNTLMFSPDNNFLLCNGNRDYIYIYDLKSV